MTFRPGYLISTRRAQCNASTAARHINSVSGRADLPAPEPDTCGAWHNLRRPGRANAGNYRLIGPIVHCTRFFGGRVNTHRYKHGRGQATAALPNGRPYAHYGTTPQWVRPPPEPPAPRQAKAGRHPEARLSESQLRLRGLPVIRPRSWTVFSAARGVHAHAEPFPAIGLGTHRDTAPGTNHQTRLGVHRKVPQGYFYW